jgi:phosphatidylserine/phosphatidylglycerophosphate/cardiolipin synthase-like enzyme
MRKKETSGALSVRAIAGSYVVMLGITMDENSSQGVLGFGIERTDHTNGDRKDWLRGFKRFEGTVVEPGALVPSNEQPIQAFLWADFTTRVKHEYTYRIVAMRGEPGKLEEGESVEVRIAMENEDLGTHAVYFNRGVAGSQAYVRKFGDKRPAEVPDREAWRWLSRGLYRALLNFIGQANSDKFGLRAAVYEFKEGGVLNAFSKALEAGADVKIVYDARQYFRPDEQNPDPKKSKIQPAEDNREEIEKNGLTGVSIPRTADPNYISHNKFIVLLEDGKPTQVWTGSTNITQGGIFGHSNVGHIVRDPKVAARYLAYWEELSNDPKLDDLRQWTETASPVPPNLPPAGTTTTLFSPLTNLEALRWYASRMDAASSAVFLTAAFGVNDLFEEVFAKDKDYLRYLLLEKEDTHMETLRLDPDVRIAVGDVLRENKFEVWMEEQLTNLNKNVRFIHTKYMLLDPLGDDPIVITGSANFSDASTRRNDENMLVIRGDTRVADIYLGEFMRLFNHFYFRYVVAGHKAGGGDARASYLKPDDSWREPYYRDGAPKQKERVYFAG